MVLQSNAKFCVSSFLTSSVGRIVKLRYYVPDGPWSGFPSYV
jgi:hypothetical protein